MIDLGTVKPGSTIRIPFSSFDKDDGSSITMTNYAAADMLIYKDGNTTERASTSGFTATTDFDGKTGKHIAVIDLADNTTSAFWNAGSEYMVAIDAVTVDAVTTGGWIARFRIGYPNAHLDTTLASLSTQTSFTLTTGPAEDDALNGSVVCIHDIASAIQCGWGVVADYTGSTKTVTLTAGVTFTAASGDNISFFPPVNAAFWNALATVKLPLAPTTAGRDLDVSAGGEAGIDWANVGSPTTALNLSATNIDVDQVVASVSGAVGSVTGAVGSVTGLTAATVHADLDDIQARLPAALVSGRIDASVGAMAANVITATAINADAITDAKVAADVTIASVTGAVGSVTGAVGSVTGNVGGNVTGTIGGLTAAALKDFFDTDSATTYASAVAGSVVKEIADNAGGSALSEAGIADAVWDEARAGHVGVGSFGEGAASVQGNVTGSVGSVTGAVGSVTGAVGSVTGLTAATVHSDLDDIQARLPAALTANGNMKVDTLRINGVAITGDGSGTPFTV